MPLWEPTESPGESSSAWTQLVKRSSRWSLPNIPLKGREICSKARTSSSETTYSGYYKQWTGGRTHLCLPTCLHFSTFSFLCLIGKRRGDREESKWGRVENSGELEEQGLGHHQVREGHHMTCHYKNPEDVPRTPVDGLGLLDSQGLLDNHIHKGRGNPSNISFPGILYCIPPHSPHLPGERDSSQEISTEISKSSLLPQPVPKQNCTSHKWFLFFFFKLRLPITKLLYYI